MPARCRFTRGRTRLFCQAWTERRPAIHQGLGKPARRAGKRHGRYRALGGRQRAGHDRRRQGRCRHRLRRRQRHQRILRPGRHQGFSDIRGHAIVVDATNTAYALQAKKILLRARARRPARITRSIRSATARFGSTRCSPTRTMPAPSSICRSRSKPPQRACTASAAPPICSVPIRPAAPSCAAPGRATMPTRWSISRRLYRGAALVARPEQPRRRRRHSDRTS